MSTAENKAVFLSYASQDAAAALRIAQALRAAGVEVWFDKDELVGGDAWDAKIRGQIGSCALFVPVISASTQARLEGYFRLEWKLASQRTHTMADEKVFLLPVVIDVTRDAEAKVPAEFRAVQWTRLPEGEASGAFCARVLALLGGSAVLQPALAASEGGLKRRATVSAAPSRLRWLIGALAVVAVLVALLAWRPWSGAGQSVAGDAAPARLAPVGGEPSTAPVSEKAIAVLPFANRSAEVDGQHLVDGVQDELRNTLAAIREITVVSGLSVERYRGTTKTYQQIGAELGVAHVFEGSVQRVGSRMRVSGRLIDARREAQVWSKSVEKEVTDIFTIQTELAKAIVQELRVVLSPEEKALVERRPTENAEAYDLYLRARAVTRGVRKRAQMRNAEEWLQAAVNLDPAFVLGWIELSFAHGHSYSSNRDRSPARLAKAKGALDEASRLAPASLEVVRATAGYHQAAGELAQAEQLFASVVRQRPNDPDAYRDLGGVAARRNRWAEAVAYYRRAVQLDPANVGAWKQLASWLRMGRRFSESEECYRRSMALEKPDLEDEYYLAQFSFLKTGSTGEVERFLAELSSDAADSAAGFRVRLNWAATRGDYEACHRLFERYPQHPAGNAEVIWVRQKRGDTDGASKRAQQAMERSRNRLKGESDNPLVWSQLSQIEAMAGDKGAALEHVRRAVELDPVSKDALRGVARLWGQAIVLARVGEKDRAITELGRLLRMPAVLDVLNVHVMRTSFHYAPLQGDPRFEALLNDPKNNAPLF